MIHFSKAGKRYKEMFFPRILSEADLNEFTFFLLKNE